VLRKNFYLLLLIYSAVAFSRPPESPHSAPNTSKIKVNSVEVAPEEIHSAKADTLSAKPPPESEVIKDTTGVFDPFYQSLQKKAEKNKIWRGIGYWPVFGVLFC
jgi:hypothetical protein